MSFEVQRVVVIVDASKDVSLSAIKCALKGLPRKPGHKLLLLGVLHQVINPSTFSKAGKLLGYKSKVDSASILGANRKTVREEVARKKEEYMNNEELKEIYQECKKAEIHFLIDVKAGASPKVVAVKAAKSFEATWVILDRQMKKDEKYLMENLSCGIARVKSNNRIEKLKGQKASVHSKTSTRKSTGESRSSAGHVTYFEMLPSGTEDELSPRSSTSLQKNDKTKGDGAGAEPTMHPPSAFYKSSSSEQLITTTVSTSSLGNTEASSSSFTEDQGSPLYFRDEETTTNTEHETAGEQSPLLAADMQEEDKTNPDSGFSLEDPQVHPSNNNSDCMEDRQQNEQFKNPICSICKNRRPKVGWKRDFTYAELQAATEGFSPRNFLSEGGFGSVYRGKLKGLKIAVKQHKSASFQGEKEFKSEVNVLSTARHENLVMLLGSCSEGNHRLLVYEYVCNGSLDQHLSKHSRRTLTWEKRMRIALGTAKGLQYLHEKNIVHRDMRPNNILVTHDFESLLGDFGLAKTRREDLEYSSETRLVGTLGYLAPEYAEYGKVSTKTDVYSFGVVLLQLITGRKTTDKSLEGKSLVGWARPLLKERNYPDLIDRRIGESHDVYQLFWMVRVAEKCLSKDPQKRVTMDVVVDVLTYIMEGKGGCSIRDFSQARSDSAGSMPDSTESQYDDRSFNADTALMHSLGYASGRLPPSPPMKPSSSGTSLSDAQSTASGETTSAKDGETSGSCHRLQ